MNRPFAYGMSVEGDLFTDREAETARLKNDFEHGINVVLMSPRRMGKTSLVKRVCQQITNPNIRPILMDIYDCRSEYDFYNRFAQSVIRGTSTKSEHVLDTIQKFLVRVTPKIKFASVPDSDMSFSLGITPKNYSPEEILSLPEKIAEEKDIHIVICIDEFQQIGEIADSLAVQKRMRSIWQHQKRVSYCLFGSKKHLMSNLFQSKSMPFYQFGELNELNVISTEKWIPFIKQRFQSNQQTISDYWAERICDTVSNSSSYVQQLAWNVMSVTADEVDEQSFNLGVEALFSQCSSYFIEQLRGLSSYQMNFVRAICSGINSGFGTEAVNEQFSLGSKSNIARIKNTLINRELIIEEANGRCFLSDSLFGEWFKRYYLNL